MHDRGRNRVSSHGETPDDVDRSKFVEDIEHDVANEWCYSVVKTDLAEIDVEGGFLATGEGEIAVLNSQLGNKCR